MKKIRIVLLAAALASLALVPTTAEGHGTCSVTGGQLQVTNKPSVTTTGGYYCGTTNHDTVTATVRIQRRTPGSSWNTIASKTVSGINVPNVSTFVEASGYNCAKDYRSLISGTASPGGHSNTKGGSIKSHTC